jgi:TetR/AcrR family transcriptional regulator, fatty acid metabolism regulator protein
MRGFFTMTNRKQQREKILDAAFEVFGSKGYYEAKMIDIAKLAGVSKGTLYLYFSSKESLYIAVNNRSFDEFLYHAKRRTDECQTFHEKLYSIAKHHLLFFYETKKYPDSFWQAPHQMPEMMGRLHQFFEDYHGLVAKLIEEQKIKNAFLHSKAFCSMLNGYKMDIVSDDDITEEDIMNYAEFIVNLYIEGCYFET